MHHLISSTRKLSVHMVPLILVVSLSHPALAVDQFVEIDVFPEAVEQLLLQMPDGRRVHVPLAGSVEFNVTFDGTEEGAATDDDRNGLDEVVAEVVDMHLRGYEPVLGPMTVTVSARVPSVGVIEERANNTLGLLDVDPFAPGAASSFFDVFVEIDLPQFGLVVTTPGAIRLSSVIGHKPPQDGELFVFSPPSPVDLLDLATGQPTGLMLVQKILQPAPTVERDVFPAAAEQLVLTLPDGSDALVPLVGDAAVNVFFEGATEGVALDHDGNGLDEVVAELVNLHLRGYEPLLGPVTVTVSASAPSLGVIEEQVNNTPGVLDVDPFAAGTADSFFDVFVEVELPDTSQILATRSPIRMGSVIDDKPPQDGELFVFAPPASVELVDVSTGEGAGIFIARSVLAPAPTIEHDVFPITVDQLLLEVPGDGSTLVPMVGNAAMDVYFEGMTEGVALDDDGNGRDEVVSELVDLQLSGTHGRLGRIEMKLRSDLPSVGAMEELVNNVPGLLDVDPFAPGSVDSFFDVYVEIDLPDAGRVLITEAPARIQEILEDKPPESGEVYLFRPRAPVELIDKATGEPTGIYISRDALGPAPTTEHDMFSETTMILSLDLGAGIEIVGTSGPSQVDVYFEGSSEGVAWDDSLNTLDEVVHQLVALTQTGTSSAGPLSVALGPSRVSLGLLEELSNTTTGLLDIDPFAAGDGTSFFDLDLRLTVGGVDLDLEVPARVVATVDTKPPLTEEFIFTETTPARLLDASGQPTGYTLSGLTLVFAPSADLAVTKTDNVRSAVPGETVDYVIEASNAGPNGVAPVLLTDDFPSTLQCKWTSVASGGASGNSDGSGDLSEALYLPALSSVTYSVSCDIASSATGTLTNTATIASTVSDPDSTNNADTDDDTVLSPMADLVITKDDGVAVAAPGDTLTYTIVVGNDGPSDAPGASVMDLFPRELINCSWSCIAANGASCAAGPVSGSIADTPDLPNGGTATYTATCLVDPGVSFTTLTNTATVDVPKGVTEVDPRNNTDSDIDLWTFIFEDGFESGDTTAWSSTVGGP